METFVVRLRQNRRIALRHEQCEIHLCERSLQCAPSTISDGGAQQGFIDVSSRSGIRRLIST